MNIRLGAWITGAITLALVTVGAWTLSQIPAGRSVPIHFRVDGQPNGWAPADIGLFIIPGVSVLMWLIQILALLPCAIHLLAF